MTQTVPYRKYSLVALLWSGLFLVGLMAAIAVLQLTVTQISSHMEVVYIWGNMIQSIGETIILKIGESAIWLYA